MHTNIVSSSPSQTQQSDNLAPHSAQPFNVSFNNQQRASIQPGTTLTSRNKACLVHFMPTFKKTIKTLAVNTAYYNAFMSNSYSIKNYHEKSVCKNTIIEDFLTKHHPPEDRLKFENVLRLVFKIYAIRCLTDAIQSELHTAPLKEYFSEKENPNLDSSLAKLAVELWEDDLISIDEIKTIIHMKYVDEDERCNSLRNGRQFHEILNGLNKNRKLISTSPFRKDCSVKATIIDPFHGASTFLKTGAELIKKEYSQKNLELAVQRLYHKIMRYYVNMTSSSDSIIGSGIDRIFRRSLIILDHHGKDLEKAGLTKDEQLEILSDLDSETKLFDILKEIPGVQRSDILDTMRFEEKVRYLAKKHPWNRKEDVDDYIASLFGTDHEK